jgi:hypothetical protein
MWAGLARAKEVGYLVAGGGEGDREKRYRFYCDRRSQRQPYVIVTKRRRYCTVRLDMLPPWRGLDPAEQAETLALLCWFSAPGAELCVGQDLAQSTKVPADQAEELAGLLVELGQRGG